MRKVKSDPALANQLDGGMVHVNIRLLKTSITIVRNP